MNEISVKRVVLAGLGMLIIAIAVAILIQIVLDQIVAPMFFAQTAKEFRLEIAGSGGRTGLNYLVDFMISVLNCMLLIWLYASLRPMYGVGTKTALTTSAFGVVLTLGLFGSLINSGLLTLKLGLIGAASNAIELPIVMLVGAAIYENREKWGQTAES